ncbi:hypothetical protein P0136_08450 [Lentisphaerota bacterium ZTH]|nr:hypothetical protein JYG24_00445 [Lentisphaerota bacterium]WET05395.1 hypothetical protein P0136_08450 [Lentisphaerota bacterium ZTH]
MIPVGQMDSKVKDIQGNLLKIFAKNRNYKKEKVRFQPEKGFYFHSGKPSHLWKTERRKKKQKAAFGMAYRFFKNKYPALYTRYYPSFNFKQIHKLFITRCRDGYMRGDDLLAICGTYLQAYNIIENGFKRKYESVLFKFFNEIYLYNQAFVFGHTHTREQSSGHSFTRDFLSYLKSCIGFDISKDHALLYELKLSNQAHYKRRGRGYSNYCSEDEYKFVPSPNYKNPNLLINHLDDLYDAPLDHIQWFAQNKVPAYFYDDGLTGGEVVHPTEDWLEEGFSEDQFQKDLKTQMRLAGFDEIPEVLNVEDEEDGSVYNKGLRARLNVLIARRMYNLIYNYDKTFIPIGKVHVNAGILGEEALQCYLKKHLPDSKNVVTAFVETGDIPEITESDEIGIDYNITWPNWG